MASTRVLEWSARQRREPLRLHTQAQPFRLHRRRRLPGGTCSTTGCLWRCDLGCFEGSGPTQSTPQRRRSQPAFIAVMVMKLVSVNAPGRAHASVRLVSTAAKGTVTHAQTSRATPTAQATAAPAQPDARGAAAQAAATVAGIARCSRAPPVCTSGGICYACTNKPSRAHFTSGGNGSSPGTYIRVSALGAVPGPKRA